MNLKHDEISNLVWDFPFLRRYLDGFELNTKRFFRDIESGVVPEKTANPVISKMIELRPALRMDLIGILQANRRRQEEEYYDE